MDNGAEKVELIAAAGSAVFFNDPTFWALVSLLIFAGIIVRMGVFGKIMTGLDNKAQQISDALDEARDLREQAQKKLAEAERLQSKSEEEAANILEAAKTELQRMERNAAEELAARMARREEMAKRRLVRAEEEAIRKIHNAATDAATTTAEKVLIKQMQGADYDKQLQSSIAKTEQFLAGKTG